LAPFYTFSETPVIDLSKWDYYVVKETDELLSLGHAASDLAKIGSFLGRFFP